MNGTHDEIQPFWKSVWDRFGTLLTGSPLAIFLTLVSVLGVLGVTVVFQLSYWIAAVVFVTAVLVTIIVAAFLAGRDENTARRTLADRLRPSLSICSATRNEEGRWRITVCNLADVTVCFGASLERIDPPTRDYRTPFRLQITGTPPPHRESEIPPKGQASVDVVMVRQSPLFLTEFISRGSSQASQPPGVPRIELLSAEHPPGTAKIATNRYEITICAFPIHPSEGNAARRVFHLIPQSDGTVMLSDAGIPCA